MTMLCGVGGVLVLACGLLSGCNSQEAAGPGPITQQLSPPPPPPYEGRQGPRRGNRAQENAQAGVFDFYLLTLSWSPEYCATHTDPAECSSHPAFVLHGLWPENADGTYPENCSNAPGPANPGQYKDIYPDQSLLAHEWKTHGTCSGLAPDAYFQAERKAFTAVKAPTQLASLTSTISLTPTAILADFTGANPSDASGDVVLACGNNRLTAIEVCLTKSLTATSCQGVKSCRANVVKITPP
jgi:ribonuclease T2